MDILQLFVSFQGRINRKTYWLAILPLIIGYAVADLMTGSADESIVGFGYLIIISLIWPSLAVQTKRWHDRNKSGWWNLIGLIPIAGPIWASIELGFLKGTSGANSYDFPPVSRPSYDYRAQVEDVDDAYISSGLRKSEPFTNSGSLKNSWRSR